MTCNISVIKPKTLEIQQLDVVIITMLNFEAVIMSAASAASWVCQDPHSIATRVLKVEAGRDFVKKIDIVTLCLPVFLGLQSLMFFTIAAAQGPPT